MADPQQSSGDRSSLFQELKRRHVVRVAVAYAAAAWLVLQLASLVLPTFAAPAWVLKVLIGVVALLFPIALVLAWAFEMTPEGVRRTEPADSPVARPPEQAHRVRGTLNTVTIVVLAAAVVVLGWQLLERRRGAPGAVSGRSVAVLPFENLSGDSANAYFAGGIQDLILTKLADIGDLKVISRTSTEQYGSHPENLRAIGRQLGVATVLEGSVQRSGQQVLINVQLINALTDSHLWAQYYTRTLNNVFGVESEVAGRVAEALRAALTPAERRRVATPATTDPAAYNLYLQADAHFQRAEDNNSLSAQEAPRAIALYEQALAHDSSFALAAAQLAMAHMYMYFFGGDRSQARLAAAKAAADRSLALRPDLGEGHLALALYEYWGRRDYADALDQLEQARKALPNSAEVEEDLASVQRRQGQWEESLQPFRRATILDPRSPDAFLQLAMTYQNLRRYAESDSVLVRGAGVARDPGLLRIERAANLIYWKGELGPARAWAATLEPGTDAYAAFASSRWWIDWLSRDFNGAIGVARSDTASDWQTANNVDLPRLLYLAWAQQRAGRDAAARQSYAAVRASIRKALALRPDDPDLHMALAYADAGLGHKTEAVKEGRAATTLMPPSRDAIAGPAYLAYVADIYALVGEDAQAVALLQRLMAMPAGGVLSPATLRIDPKWDPLRKDPGFQALARVPAGDSATAQR